MLYRIIEPYQGHDTKYTDCFIVEYCLVDPISTVDDSWPATILVSKYVYPYELFGGNTQRKISNTDEIRRWLSEIDISNKFYMTNVHGATIGEPEYLKHRFVNKQLLDKPSTQEIKAVSDKFQEMKKRCIHKLSVIRMIAQRVETETKP